MPSHRATCGKKLDRKVAIVEHYASGSLPRLVGHFNSHQNTLACFLG